MKANKLKGDKLYEKRARVALPLLVRQAEAGVSIVYSDLAKELQMPNPRNLNYVLGKIGVELEKLSKEWKKAVPQIQCLVISKNTGVPGEGIGPFLKNKDFAMLSSRHKRKVIEHALQDVFSYRQWQEVLRAFSLAPVNPDFSTIINKASEGIGGGESENHKALKIYVAKNPTSVGLEESIPVGATEEKLPSGDAVDVLFKSEKVWVVIEVKSAISSDADIVRGLFQCVKYRAVVEAMLISQALPQAVTVLLVLESSFPQSLVPLKNILGIEVVEGITPKKC